MEQYKDSPTLKLPDLMRENWKGISLATRGGPLTGHGYEYIYPGKPNIITLNKPLNLAPFDTIYTYVNIDTEEMIQKLTLS